MEVLLDNTHGSSVDLVSHLRDENKHLKQEIEFLRSQLEQQVSVQQQIGLLLRPIEINELFNRKLMVVHNEDSSRTCKRHYELGKKFFCQWAKGNGIVFAHDMVRDHVDIFDYWLKYKARYNDKPLSKHVRIQIFIYIKATFQYALERDHVIRNYFPNKQIECNPIEDWWEDGYYYKLIEAVQNYASDKTRYNYESIIRGIYTTGLRITKLLGIKHKDVKLTEDGRVYVTVSLKCQKTKKYQKEKVELFNIKFKEMFLEQYEYGKEGYVLIPGKAKPECHADELRKALRGYITRGGKYPGICEKAGIPYKKLHPGKHGLVTKLIMHGNSYEQIGKLTTNKDPKVMRKHYDHVLPDHLRENFISSLGHL